MLSLFGEGWERKNNGSTVKVGEKDKNS